MKGKFNYTAYAYVDTKTGNLISGGKGQYIYSDKNTVKRSMVHSYDLQRLIEDEWLERTGHSNIVSDYNYMSSEKNKVSYLKWNDPIYQDVEVKLRKVARARSDTLQGFSVKEFKTLREELTGDGGRFKIMEISELTLKDPQED